LKEGSQVYAVYPLVAESEKLDLKSAVEMEKQWAARFKDYKVDIIHGQMKKEDRDRVMADFKDKKVAVLVATTVIEVGIDVPNAAVIVIEHAERFGLSQLHQLRGRVGRGEKQSYCILVGDPTTEDGMKRLAVMTSTSDGFKISEEDLAIRGPGEFMGTRQHGLHEFRVADIIKDRNIMELSRQAALWITSPECDLDHIAKEELIDRIRTRYGDSFNLINVG
jgi:ATP-dependent DNA helicase RecG